MREFLKRPIFISTLFSLIFLSTAVLTLPDYGVSWDSALHWRRGQAYLYYFLTGQANYDKLPHPNLQGTNGDPKKIPFPRRSFYQNDFHNGEFFLKNDSGHPPLNGELAALSNYIFFQKLGLLDDISSHHLFNILASSLLVFVVVFFAAETFGTLAAVVSFLTLVTYPLFWAESHFNVKDPAEAAFFAGTLWAFYKSLNRGNVVWLISGFIFFALALGTKFNILFLPFILFPCILFRFGIRPANLVQSLKLVSKKYYVTLLAGPILVLGVFIGTWPFLWHNWPENIFKIFSFYKEIGIGLRYQPEEFFVFGFNTYPTQWILFTTPPLVLILSAIGLVSAWINRKKYNCVTFLWLLWLLVPVARVTVPQTVIYGGVRQILEFLPAMVLLCGLGAWQILRWTKKVKIATLLVLLLAFIWPIFILVKLHPNQNVYFNQLIGGLRGAMERNFPSWGNSFGNAYLQGIRWINENTEKGAKLALIQGTTANVPIILLREDINYQNSNWSGIERKGEYLMDLTFNDTVRNFNYAWEYVENFLNPVYELKVDNVSILKIWKNDLEYTNKQYRADEVLFKGQLKNYSEGKNLVLELFQEANLSQVELSFSPKTGCVPLRTGFVETSLNGKNWQREKDWVPFPQVRGKQNIEGNKITFFFAAKRAKFVRFVLDNQNSCVLNNPIPQVKIIERSTQ